MPCVRVGCKGSTKGPTLAPKAGTLDALVDSRTFARTRVGAAEGMISMTVPFRWNIARREQLGGLVAGEAPVTYSEFFDDLCSCAAKVLARSRNSDLLFIGRSPESIFDYLSGALTKTTWASRLALVNLSLRHLVLTEIEPERLAGLRAHLTAVGADPAALASGSPASFVDLVHSGSTLAALSELIVSWTRNAGVDLNAVTRNVRFVGITWRKKTSPNTFRWQQHAPWLDAYPANAVKNVSVPGRLWDYLGNAQAKVALSNPPWRWGSAEILRAPHYPKNLEALRLACRIYDLGVSDQGRLATTIAALPEMRHLWLRSLVAELRRTGA